MSIFEQVKKYAIDINSNNWKGKKWIYYHDGIVDLITRLPREYWRKTEILIVGDPTNYLRVINNRSPTEYELKLFTFFEPSEEFVRQPHDTMKEQLLKLPIGDIVNSRRISKEYKDIIDENSFWCQLLDRDYPKMKYNKDSCEATYKDIYLTLKSMTITDKQIDDAIKKYVRISIRDSVKEFIEDDLLRIPFKKANDKFILDFDLKEQFQYRIQDLIFDRVPKYTMKFKPIIFNNLISKPDYLNILKDILPKFMFIETVNVPGFQNSYITMYVKDYIRLYDFTHNFDNDLKTVLDKTILDKRLTPILTSQQMVKLIHEIVDYQGDDYKTYFASKYNLIP